MKRVLFGLILLSVFAQAEDLGVQVDTESTLKVLQGDYAIQKVDRKLPKEDNEEGSVAFGAKETVFTLPYCAPGGSVCDPGFVYLPYDKTKTYRKDVKAKHFVLTFLNDDAGVKLRYRWENDNGRITFTNFQYDDAGKVRALEYQLAKLK
jgi:hypothetical protein